MYKLFEHLYGDGLVMGLMMWVLICSSVGIVMSLESSVGPFLSLIQNKKRNKAVFTSLYVTMIILNSNGLVDLQLLGGS